MYKDQGFCKTRSKVAQHMKTKNLHGRPQMVSIGVLSWICLIGFVGSVGCSSVQSTVSSVLPGGEKKEKAKIKAGEKLNLNVSPQVALMLFRDVAAEKGWEVKSAGDQRDINGEVTGKFFRVETVQFVGGQRIMTGVFFKEKKNEEASHVMMGKPGTETEYGIPIALVKPLQAAVAEWTGEVDEDSEEEGVAEEELSPLEAALSEDFDEEDEADLEDESDEDESDFEESEFSSLDDALSADFEDESDFEDEEEFEGVEEFEDIELTPEEEALLEEIELSPTE